MPEYLFDVKMWASVHVDAANEKEARKKLEDAVTDLVINHDANGVKIFSLQSEGSFDLTEIDGEAV